MTRKVKRDDVTVLYVPATDIAAEEGLTAAANVILLTVYLKHKGIMPTETLKKIIPVSVSRKEFVAANLRIVDKALEYYETIS